MAGALIQFIQQQMFRERQAPQQTGNFFLLLFLCDWPQWMLRNSEQKTVRRKSRSC